MLRYPQSLARSRDEGQVGSNADGGHDLHSTPVIYTCHPRNVPNRIGICEP